MEEKEDLGPFIVYCVVLIIVALIVTDQFMIEKNRCMAQGIEIACAKLIDVGR